MRGRSKLVVALAAIAASVAVAVAGAAAASSAPKNDRIVIRGGVTAKPGFYIKDLLRFTPYKSAVRSGGTITIVAGKGAMREGPHTFSLVRKRDLPTTAKQIENCKVCGQIAQAHEADPNSEAPPARPLVDGGDGFNKPGDSVFFDGHTLKLKATAKRNTTLYYMCAIHPWMQGRISVK